VESSHQIRIGTAGWSYKDWEGVFYPPEVTRRKLHPLEYMARFFDVVEINTSFSEHIRPELGRLWCRRVAAVNPNFNFTAKLHRSFTHSPVAVVGPTSAATILPTDEDEALAREGLDTIASEGKLGALLIQFPISFKNTSLNREYLDRLLRQFIEYPRVVEVRHASWDNPETLLHFTQQSIAFCNIDQSVLVQSVETSGYVPPNVGYVRLHGRNCDQWFESNNRDDYLYKESELGDWKTKINRVAETAKTTYVIANNYFEGKAAVNALELKALLTGNRLGAPPGLIKTYPELRKFADPLEDDNPNLSLLA
jgi:uncharacterized protein YecE (DUF72 family)